MGPTATGKSQLAMDLAERTGAEILSVDSMQVYRGMDIGTAKASRRDRERVTHHMIDLVSPSEGYSAAQFQAVARRTIADTTAPAVVIAGGSGLHFRAVVDPMTFRPTHPHVRGEVESMSHPKRVEELLAADPRASEHVDLDNPRRVIRAVEVVRISGVTPSGRAADPGRLRYRSFQPQLEFTAVGIDRDDVAERVAIRLESMRRLGLLDEVRDLAPNLGRTASQAVGYKELLDVVAGSLPAEEGFERARHATMRLVKRQRTYFRRDPRIEWLDGSDSRLLDRASRIFEL